MASLDMALDETHKYFEASMLFKPCGALGRLFEVAGQPSATLHPIRPKQMSAVCTLGTTNPFVHA